jgi:hypothetical protein
MSQAVLFLLLMPTVQAHLSFRTQELDHTLKVGYCVIIADVNSDQKPDIVVADAQRVIWFENPTWKLRNIIVGQTKPDNVSLAAHDIDGDGLVDFALAADWKPMNTKNGGTLQWLQRGKTLDDPWKVHLISDDIPTIHRIRFARVRDKMTTELIVAPLMGRNTTAQTNWSEAGVDLQSFSIPKKPVKDRWPSVLLDRSHRVMHNFEPVELLTKGGQQLLLASYDGLSLLNRPPGGDTKDAEIIGLHTGDQSQPTKNRGCSEVKLGRLKDQKPIIATIEPWHGNQVVLYEPVDGQLTKEWKRTVIDKDLKWGHALAWADFDGDGVQELVVGVRDSLNKDHPCGVRLYRQQPNKSWQRQMIDPAGVAVEDLAVADLNGDGKPDIVAVGRATGNVRVYWCH